MSASAATVLMPDAEPAWKLWRSLTSNKSEALDSPTECRDRSKPVVVGLPATACRTIGLVLPAAEPSLLPAMIEAQLEHRGVTVLHDPAPNFAWHILGQDATSTIVSVDVLAQPFPENLAVNHAVNYTAAMRLMTLPSREITLIEEQGLMVVATGHNGKLWHSHIVGPADMAPADLARELAIVRLGLDSVDGMGVLRGYTLVGERLLPLKAELKSLTGVAVETAPALEPNRALKLDSFQKLLPASVHLAQGQKAARRRFFNIALLCVTAYAGAIAAGALHLNGLQKQVDSLKADVAETDGPAATVRDTATRWNAMEPAIDPRRYPMVQLSEITALMPPSGVLIRRVETKIHEIDKNMVNEIEITGDARDAQTATQFLEDLKSNAKLNQFTWTMPVPSVKDRVAAFKIQGKSGGK
ncbi:MAG TPA: hypothetical protein VGH65_09540 [Verrucomicrobiaceae bacterium]